jgi:hypothetical protein
MSRLSNWERRKSFAFKGATSNPPNLFRVPPLKFRVVLLLLVILVVVAIRGFGGIIILCDSHLSVSFLVSFKHLLESAQCDFS